MGFFVRPAAVVLLAVAVATGFASVPAAQSQDADRAVASTPVTPLPLPPVGSVSTTPTEPPSTACGPGPVGGDIKTFQDRIFARWPVLVQNPDSLGLAGLWFDNEVPAARLDVLDPAQIPGLCAQAVAAGVGGDVRVDVVPTTEAQMHQMQGTIQTALDARFGAGQTGVEFWLGSIKTWSLDIVVRPGIDQAAVAAIAQTQPVAYSIRETTGNLTFTPDVAVATAPSVRVPARCSRATARRGVLVRVAGVRGGSRVRVIAKRGKRTVAVASVRAPRVDGSPYSRGASVRLRTRIPNAALPTHGSVTFSLVTETVGTDGEPAVTTSKLRVS